jgi:hypothetical protein
MFFPITPRVPSSYALGMLRHTASASFKQISCQVDRLFNPDASFGFDPDATARSTDRSLSQFPRMKTVSARHHADPTYAGRVHRRVNAVLLIIILAVLVLITRSSAQAATVTWKNAGSTDWNTNGSWSPSGVPASADNATFSGAKASNPNLSASDIIQGLTYTATGIGYDLTSSTIATKLTLTNAGTGATSAINAVNAGGTNIIDAPIVLGAAANSTQTFTQTTGGTLTLNGAITSTNSPVTLNLVGGGTVLVDGNIASSIAVTVNGSGTTLGGTGTLSGSLALGNTTAGAIINPGKDNSTAGTLTTTGALTLTGSNTLHIDAFGTAQNTWDQVAANGVTLGLTSSLQLSIASGLNFTSGSMYTIINNTSASLISGTFSNAASGSTVNFSGYNFTVNYAGGTGNDLVLTAVPEPSTWLAAALTLAVIGYTQRRELQPVLARMKRRK